jgi:hypothetical protein
MLRALMSGWVERAFDRPDHARHRRSRSRSRIRIGAAAVALTIATGGTTTALVVFDADQRAPVAEPSTNASGRRYEAMVPVWPENPIRSRGSDPEAIQRLLDRGEEQFRWRLDPETVAVRFASIVLGWTDVTSASRVGREDDRSHVVWIRPRCDADQGSGADTDCEVEPLRLELAQPVTEGPTGIWSIVDVKSSALSVHLGDVATTQRNQIALHAGSTIRYEVDVPESVRAHIGYALTNGCEVATDFDVGLSSGTHVLRAPTAWSRADAGCGAHGAGYVFVYAQSSATVPVGDPFVEAAAFEYPWLSVVPVHVELGDVAARPT